MSDPQRNPGDLDLDLDEDLFDFDEVLEASDGESDKVDLDELLKVLEDVHAEPEAPPESAGGNAPEPDELIGSASEDAAARASAPAQPVSAAVPVLSGRFARVGVAILAGLALLNVVQIGLSWERNRDLSEALLEMESRFLLAAGDLQQDLFHQSEAMERNRMPVVSADSAGHASLEHVEHQLRAGQFAEARRRLYSLLAVVDRYGPEAAERVEGDARYLLAESWKLQDDAREDSR